MEEPALSFLALTVQTGQTTSRLHVAYYTTCEQHWGRKGFKLMADTTMLNLLQQPKTQYINNNFHTYTETGGGRSITYGK